MKLLNREPTEEMLLAYTKCQTAALRNRPSPNTKERNMNDREMLELAAKASGRCAHTEVEGIEWEDGNDAGTDWNCKACGKSPDYWNPLTDDGDAMRLAVKLELTVSYRTVNVDVSRGGVSSSEHIPTYKDPYAATRRAIVRAAAEIGKMKGEK